MREKSEVPKTEFSFNDEKLKDPLMIAQQFNEYFTDIGSHLASKMPSGDKQPEDMMKGNYELSMYVALTTEMAWPLFER